MFDPLIHVSWSAGLLWLAGITGAAFLVSWLLSDLRPTRRVFYIPALSVVTGALTAGYLAWGGGGVSFWTNRWGYGLVGAVVAGIFLTAVLRRGRVRSSEPGSITAGTLGWDGLVYGAAEGLLLSVLPVLVVYQMLFSNGWDGGWSLFGAATLALVASIVVIVAHHLGYPDFRSSRVKMGQAILGCGVLSLAYLLTASVIAPILAHAALHVAVTRFGMELPPHEEAKQAPLGSRFSEAA